MNFVVYYIVQEKSENESGLNAQRADVETFIRQNGGEVAAEFVEVERGRQSAWPKLTDAIARAKEVQGTLLIATLGHLVRNATFTASLRDSGIEFECYDNPNVNPQTIRVLAAVATGETRRISLRTKAALQSAKARGVKLGSAREGHWEGREDRRREGTRKGLSLAVKAATEARKKKADDAYRGLLSRIVKMHDEEKLTLGEIAKRMNAEGHETSAHLPFTATMICRLLKRADQLKVRHEPPPPEPPADFSDLPLFRPSVLPDRPVGDSG